MVKKAAKEKPNWAEVRRIYESRAYTAHQLSVRMNIPKSTLYKKINEEGWGEGVASAMVSRRTHERLIRETNEFSDDLEAAIELTAATNAQVIREHRTAAGRGRHLAFRMLAELEEIVDNVPALAALVEQSESDEDVRAIKKDVLLRKIDIGSRVTNLKDLSVATKNWIEIERQAFGLDRDEANETELTEEQVDARLARLLRKAQKRDERAEDDDDDQVDDASEEGGSQA